MPRPRRLYIHPDGPRETRTDAEDRRGRSALSRRTMERTTARLTLRVAPSPEHRGVYWPPSPAGNKSNRELESRAEAGGRSVAKIILVRRGPLRSGKMDFMPPLAPPRRLLFGPGPTQ